MNKLSASRVAFAYGQTTQDADGIPLRYPSTLIRFHGDYGENRAMLPRGLDNDMDEAKDFLRGLGQKVAARFSPSPTVRIADMETNVLDGLRKQKVIDILNRLLNPHTKGMHRDQYWAPVQAIRAAFEREGIPASPVDGSGRYEKENGVDVRKVWLYEVAFLNQNGRPDKVYVRIVASGGGPVASPLDVYDVVAYAS